MLLQKHAGLYTVVHPRRLQTINAGVGTLPDRIRHGEDRGRGPLKASACVGRAFGIVPGGASEKSGVAARSPQQEWDPSRRLGARPPWQLLN